MPAPDGNRFWEKRSSHGRKPIFETPEDLWNAACEYFAWVEDNPLISVELVKFQGVATKAELPKMRAMTIQGLCIFLDINRDTFYDYKSKEGFSDIVNQIDQVIYQQKITGAAADMLNPNIIARELGLTDKKDHMSSDGSMSPDGLTSEQRKNRIAELLSKNSKD